MNPDEKIGSKGLDVIARTPSIPITAWGVAVVLAVIAIGCYITLPQRRGLTKFSVSVLAATGAIVSAFYIGRSIEIDTAYRKKQMEVEAAHRKKEFEEILDFRKKERAHSYILQWASPSFAIHRKSLRSVAKVISEAENSDRPNVIRQFLKENPPLEERVITIMNFLESLAVAVKEKWVDEEVIKDYYLLIFTRIYESLDPWIEDMRRRRDDKDKVLFEAFESVSRRWIEASKKN